MPNIPYNPLSALATDPEAQKYMALIMQTEQARQYVRASQNAMRLPPASMVPQQPQVTPQPTQPLQQGTLPSPFQMAPGLTPQPVPDMYSGYTPEAAAAGSDAGLPPPNQPQLPWMTPAGSDAGMTPPPNQPMQPVAASDAGMLPPPGQKPALGPSPFAQVGPSGPAMPQPMAGQSNPMQSMGAQLPPEIAPGPATTPEEQQKRVSGWQALVEKLKSDPHMQLALIKFGTQMMQPIQPGQTVAGHVGNAVGGSIDYLQAQRAAESKINLEGAQAQHAQAGAGLQGAQAVTEGQRPEEVAAQAAAIKQRTATEKAMTPLQVQEVSAKIRSLGAQAGLDDAKMRDLQDNITLRKNPRYGDAVIAELEAKAWALRNPQEAAKGYGAATLQYTERLADALIGSGIYPEIDAVAKTDMAKAKKMAFAAANDRRLAGGALAAGQEDTAVGALDFFRSQYAAKAAAGDKSVKGMTEDQYILQQLENPLSPISKPVATQIYKQLGKQKKSTPATAPAAGPAGEDPLGLRKKP